MKNLEIINEFKPMNFSYVQREVEIQKNIKALKAWWPHYKWLKKNNINCRQFEQQKEYDEIIEKLKITKRLTDFHLSKQAIEVAETLADK